ncbi:MAG: glycoside hydrolase [Clostridia bacterium]|nr:glycoside hydrolase [Clostridia bacterium]
MLTLENIRLYADDLGLITLENTALGVRFRELPAKDARLLCVRETRDEILVSFIKDGLTLEARWSLFMRKDQPTCRMRLSAVGEDEMESELGYPAGFEVRHGDLLVAAYNEGMLFPVDDPDIALPKEGFMLGSSGTSSMSMWGILRGKENDAPFLLASVITNHDAILYETRDEAGLSGLAPFWMPEKGHFGYTREIDFVLSSGGLTSLAAAYRAVAEERGLVKTFREKAEKTPAVAAFPGRANVWLWNDDAMHKLYDADAEYRVPDEAQKARRLEIARDMKASGMDNVLWSIFDENYDKDLIAKVKSLGFLTTTYDIYTDVIPASVAERIPDTRRVRCAHRVAWWPKGIRIERDGSYARAWSLKGKDGVFYDQNDMCDVLAADCARAHVPDVAHENGLDGYFFDVTTQRLGECWSEEHPQTRREANEHKKELLGIAHDEGLFCGTENGREDFLGEFDYSEGMMSITHFRSPDAGRRMTTLYSPDEIEPNILKYALNPAYRIPLWEMVYHDCSVSYWYWGDSSNCCPSLFETRDLFNVLYGLPGLYSFRAADWELLKAQILASYEKIDPVARASEGSRMTAFEWLTEDRLVQKSTFGELLSVVANFSDHPFIYEGHEIAPMGYLVI